VKYDLRNYAVLKVFPSQNIHYLTNILIKYALDKSVEKSKSIHVASIIFNVKKIDVNSELN